MFWVLFPALGASAQAPTPGEAPPTPPAGPGTLPGPQPVPPQPGPVSPPTTPTVPTPPPTAQEEPEAPPTETPVESRTIPEELLPSGVPMLRGPSAFVGPDLFNPPAQQGWLSLTPTFTLSGEFNDNLFHTATDKTSDLTIGLTPGMTVSVQRRGLNLLAGYYISGQLYVDNSDLNAFGKNQQFFVDLLYQISPKLTFTLTEGFVRDQNSSGVTTTGESLGRRDGYRNTLTPRLRWQVTPTTGLNMVASYTLQRFDQDSGSSTGRDTYRFGLGADHQFTRRMTGTFDVDFAYLDVDGESPVRSYTFRPGLGYAITSTLRADVRAGPSIIDGAGNDEDVRPSVTALVTKVFKFGALRLGYDRNVRADGSGVSEVQAFFGSLTMPLLVRGLQLSFTPRYSILDRDVVDTGDESQTKVATVNLRATYQIARNFTLIGSYTFVHQTDDRDTRRNGDFDQNRVFLGVQYAFPINFY